MADWMFARRVARMAAKRVSGMLSDLHKAVEKVAVKWQLIDSFHIYPVMMVK